MILPRVNLLFKSRLAALVRANDYKQAFRVKSYIRVIIDDLHMRQPLSISVHFALIPHYRAGPEPRNPSRHPHRVARGNPRRRVYPPLPDHTRPVSHCARTHPCHKSRPPHNNDAGRGNSALNPPSAAPLSEEAPPSAPVRSYPIAPRPFRLGCRQV